MNLKFTRFVHFLWLLKELQIVHAQCLNLHIHVQTQYNLTNVFINTIDLCPIFRAMSPQVLKEIIF